jgi:hypothetical protein
VHDLKTYLFTPILLASLAACGGGGGSVNPEQPLGTAQAQGLDSSTSSVTTSVLTPEPTLAEAQNLLIVPTIDLGAAVTATDDTTVLADAALAAQSALVSTGTSVSASADAPNVSAAAVSSSMSCDLRPALPAIPTVPSNYLSVTNFGAIPNDNLPDDAAIARALAALQPGQWLVFPPGRYIQSKSIYVKTKNVVLWGKGATIHATNPDDQTIGLNADGASIYYFTLTADADIRRTAARHSRISVYRDDTLPDFQSGNVVRRNVITHTATSPNGGSGGVLVYRAKDFTVAENTVRRTLADGIHITNGSNNGKVMFNTVSETGDDMIGVVSYMGPLWQSKVKANLNDWVHTTLPLKRVHDVVISNNDLGGNYWGRGVGVVGSSNITIRDNKIHHVTRAAGILIGQEAGYNTFGVKNILVTGNTISQIQTTTAAYVPALNTSLIQALKSTSVTGHGGIEVYAYGNSASDVADPVLAPWISVSDVRIENNKITETVADAVRVGVASPTQLIGQASFKKNTGTTLKGRLLNNVLATTAKTYCAGNIKDGTAWSDVAMCKAATDTASSVTGAALDCSGALK